VKEIFKREVENWVGSEDEDSEDEEESEEDDEEDDDDVEEEDVQMTYSKPTSEESARKSKRKGKETSVYEDSETALAAPSSVFDDEQESTSAATDDSLPHPRPFESRRDFFQRTSNEWQEILMQSLRWKGIQPETLSVKEIKTKAFEMSEEKWWDCREEITALEDEQDAAGVGEVVSLADRGDAGAGGRRR